MNIRELIERLSEYPEESEVMILDGFNGSGFPREINLGPTTRIITRSDEDNTADCDGVVGYEIVIMGYGCY